MAKKRKNTVWHKKSGKFIPSASIKSHQAGKRKNAQTTTGAGSNQKSLETFAKDLSSQIKKAAREDS